LQSNGDFYLDRMPQAPVWWPIPLYQEAEGSATDHEPVAAPEPLTPFPMNVYIRDEAELAAFVNEQLARWIGLATQPGTRPSVVHQTEGESERPEAADGDRACTSMASLGADSARTPAQS
jgi:hypothetical protein